MLKLRAVSVFAVPLFSSPSLLAAITGTVIAPDGKPIAGARVAAYAIESSEARRARLVSPKPEPAPLAEGRTDEKGAFTIDVAGAPVVDVHVTARGWQPLAKRAERDEPPLVFVSSSAEPRTARITSGDRPLAGATVVLGYPSMELVLRTNEKGEYEVPDPRRVTTIAVLHPDHAIDEDSLHSLAESAQLQKTTRSLARGTPLRGRVTADDGTTPVAGAQIALDGWPLATSGEDGAFTISHAPARWEWLSARTETHVARRGFSKDPQPLLRLQRAAIVSGAVTDTKTGAPIAGAQVRLVPQSMTFRGGDSSIVTSVDAKGRFTLSAPAGSFTLHAWHHGYESELAQISLTAAQSAQLDLALRPLARIGGVVLDEERKPVAAATIAFEGVDDVPRGGGMRTMSGADGTFTLRVAGGRPLKIRAAKRGFASGRSDILNIDAGERRRGVVLTIPAGIEIGGKVTDTDGRPLSGAIITAAETAGRGGGPYSDFALIRDPRRDDLGVRSGSDGTFSLRLTEGSWDLAAVREGYIASIQRAHTVSAGGGAAPVEFRLETAVEISGRVVRNGAGVGEVSVNAGASGAHAVTAPDGSFTIGGLAAGPVTLSVMRLGELASTQRSLTAPAREVIIDLPAGQRISGRVIEKSSRGAMSEFEAGVTPSRAGAVTSIDFARMQQFASADGSFVIEHVPPGTVLLVARAPGFASVRRNLTIEEGKDAEGVVIELERGVRLTGRVTDASGAPVSDVRVARTSSGLRMHGGRGEGVDTTNSRGEFVLENLPPGSDEVLSFSHPKFLPLSKKVTIESREMHVDAQLATGRRLAGVVVNESGAPIADAVIRVDGMGGPPRSTRSGADGAFELDTIAPLRYRISATRSGYAETLLQDYDAASSEPLRIVLRAGGTIYGRVSGLSAQELAMTFVSARANSPASIGIDSPAPVDASGNYRIEGSAVGTVRVMAMLRGPSGGRQIQSPPVEVRPGSPVQVDLQFRNDVVIRGRVTQNGVPLTSGSVSFSARRQEGTNNVRSSIDSEGRYAVTGLEDGMHWVNVSGGDNSTHHQTEYEVRGSATFDIDFTTSPLRGRVVDGTTGRAAPGVSVRLLPLAPATQSRVDDAVSDESGAFVISSVGPGSYLLTATLAGFAAEPREIVVGRTPAEGIELRLVRSEGMTLNVVDGRTSQPIRAWATAFDARDRAVAQTTMWSPSGAPEELVLAVVPGSYRVMVSAAGYVPQRLMLTAPGTHTVTMSRGGRLEIRSKHHDVRYVRIVSATTTDSRRPALSLSPAATMPIDQLAPGSYTLELLGGDQKTVVDQVPFVIEEGKTTAVEI